MADPDVAARGGQQRVPPPWRSDQARDGAVGGSGIPDAFAEEQQAWRSKIAQRAIRKLGDGELRTWQGAEHIGERHSGARHAVGELLGVAAGFAGSVHVDGDALGLLGIERSEEHTSELQSPDHLVCRLLLEKKKNNNSQHTSSIIMPE